MAQESVIIVAGGTGSRMKANLPKQFLLLNGRPVLMHTIERFVGSNQGMKVVISMHPGYIGFWEDLCGEHDFVLPHQIVEGGDTRYHSVKNGLEHLILKEHSGLVAVHDAVRAMTPPEVIRASFNAAAEHGAAVAAVSLKDSIRRMGDSHSHSLDRSAFRLVQTPQTFRLNELYEAYQQIAHSQEITDDASVWEKAGKKVFLVEGSYKNIKITTPEDLEIAALWV